MVRKSSSTLAAVLTVLLLAGTAYGQGRTEKRLRLKAASLDGTTGLFRTWDAETLGGVSWIFPSPGHRYHRDPGHVALRYRPLRLRDWSGRPGRVFRLVRSDAAYSELPISASIASIPMPFPCHPGLQWERRDSQTKRHLWMSLAQPRWEICDSGQSSTFSRSVTMTALAWPR